MILQLLKEKFSKTQEYYKGHSYISKEILEDAFHEFAKDLTGKEIEDEHPLIKKYMRMVIEGI
jgi:hypothetical protein